MANCFLYASSEVVTNQYIDLIHFPCVVLKGTEFLCFAQMRKRANHPEFWVVLISHATPKQRFATVI